MTVKKTPVHRDDAANVPSLSRLHDIDRTVSASAEDIRGRMVKDKDGRDIGKIEHLLIDDVEQKVRFMEVGSGGFLGLGETKSFIPIEAITRITADEVYISPTREHVADTPRYDPDLVAKDPGYFFDLYAYYGYEGWVSPRRSPDIPAPSSRQPSDK
ncbi:MAG: PRC-barrel domain containing protein [Chloroflexi bacterium]|nr:PRC-barrel domain containing protein [Chloroflexota bacterium]